MRRFGVGVVALVLVLMVCGCNTWERDTFNTLAVAQGVINQAKADYRDSQIPVNKCSYTLITEATAADTLAVNAMAVYEQEKTAGGDLSAQQAIVTNELTSLGPLVSDIGLLKSNPIAACAGVNVPSGGA